MSKSILTTFKEKTKGDTPIIIGHRDNKRILFISTPEGKIMEIDTQTNKCKTMKLIEVDFTHCETF